MHFATNRELFAFIASLFFAAVTIRYAWHGNGKYGR
jgi:hypothetical protein